MRYATSGVRAGGQLALVAAFLAVLVGCAGEQSPPPPRASPSSAASAPPYHPQPSPTAAPTGTTSSTPSSSTVQVVPAAAREHSDAGAEAFVRFYIDQLNVSWTTPTAQLLGALSEPDCASCASLQATANRLVVGHERYASAPVSIRSVTAFGGGPPGQQFVHLVMDQHRVDVIDGRGVVVASDAAKELKRNVVLKWRAEAWHVYGIAE